MCISYLCEVADDIFYEGSIGNNLFIVTYKAQIAYIQTSPSPTLTPHTRRWEDLNGIRGSDFDFYGNVFEEQYFLCFSFQKKLKS